jgi:hypothetical protein
MSLGELARIALVALGRNKLRSGLTLLGVIIGVMTVVSVVSIIAGLNTYVETKLTNLNPDVLVFTKYGIIRSRAEFILATRRKALTMRETRLVAEECGSCAAAPMPRRASSGLPSPAALPIVATPSARFRWRSFARRSSKKRWMQLRWAESPSQRMWLTWSLF